MKKRRKSYINRKKDYIMYGFTAILCMITATVLLSGGGKNGVNGEAGETESGTGQGEAGRGMGQAGPGGGMDRERGNTDTKGDTDVSVGTGIGSDTGVGKGTDTSASVRSDGGEPEITLVMVGDILLHTPVAESGKKEDGSYDFGAVFSEMREEISSADLALVNQEVILGGEELGVSGYPAFNAPYELGDALVEAGFDVVLHATNHALDKGKKGIVNCLAFWQKEYPDIAVLGIHGSEAEQEEIYVYEQDGIRLAILNYTYGTNGIALPQDMPYAVDLLERERVEADLQRAQEVADFVVVCPHWGTEYVLEETAEQEQWAAFFADNGADLILGTHPHVIEPVEWEGAALVYYSLGNFVNWTSGIGEGVANRMVGGTNWKGDKSAYTYNGLGLRVNNTHTTHAGKVYARDYVIDYTSFENDDLMVFAEGNGQLEYEQKHVYAGSERIEQFTDKGNWERTLYVHEDVMGNTRYYTKANGQSFAELTYDAWGMPESPNKLLNNDHGNYVFATFTGHIYDTTLDIYFAEARFYDANNRTWLAIDPIKDGGNWYQYCFSNPTTYYDPTGLAGFSPFSGCVDISKLVEQMTAGDEQNSIIEGIRTIGKVAYVIYKSVADEFKDSVKDLNGTVTVKGTFNATAYVGIYIDIGLSFDWKGNTALQWSYAIPGVDDTLSLGVLDIGATISVAFTDANDIYELLGKSSAMGVSTGFFKYLSFDLLSFDEMEDTNGDIDGLQIGVGYGGGFDIHMMESYTREIYSLNIYQGIDKTFELLGIV